MEIEIDWNWNSKNSGKPLWWHSWDWKIDVVRVSFCVYLYHEILVLDAIIELIDSIYTRRSKLWYFFNVIFELIGRSKFWYFILIYFELIGGSEFWYFMIWFSSWLAARN